MADDPQVPLREHLAALREADAKLRDALRQADLLAVDKALASSSKLSEAHNDLLRKMEKQAETYATKDDVDSRLSRTENGMARLYGGLAVVGAIGIGNLVQLWLG